MFDPAQFLALAEKLGADAAYTDAAAKTRTALGRAYYSLFLAVRSAIRKAEGKGIDVPITGGDHGHLYRTLQGNGATPDLKAVGKTLEELYGGRRRADYELDPPQLDWVKRLQNPSFAVHNLELARDVIGRLPRIDFTPMKGKV